jgi:TPR repeat protein
MPKTIISCVSLSPATRSSVPIYDYATANEELADENMEQYYPCCGKSICAGCVHSCIQSGNYKCPFCNSDQGKTYEERFEQMMKRVEANDPISISLLAGSYYQGLNGLQQDQTKTMELYGRAADLGCSEAHNNLANVHKEGGNRKKAKFHFEAAAMAGHEIARCNLGVMEYYSGNMERGVKHWTISASGGCYQSMHHLRESFEEGYVSRESINSTLTRYNNSCKEMRSEARDAYQRAFLE